MAVKRGIETVPPPPPLEWWIILLAVIGGLLLLIIIIIILWKVSLKILLIICINFPLLFLIKQLHTQPDSHYIRYTAASVLKSTTLSTPEGHWLTCAW